MPANTRWIHIGVLASFNLAILCLSRPIAEAIGWGWDSSVADCMVLAPSFAACFLAMIASRSLLIRTLTTIAALFVTSVVNSALTQCGYIHFPDLSHIERDASTLFLYLGPACVLIYLLAGFVDVSFSTHDEQRMQNRNRLSIAGLMIATTVLFAAILWKSDFESRRMIACYAGGSLHVDRLTLEPWLRTMRARNVRLAAIYGPVIASLMLCGWWASISRVRCLVLLVLAIALGAFSRSSGDSLLLMVTVGFPLFTAHVAVNVFVTRLLQQ